MSVHRHCYKYRVHFSWDETVESSLAEFDNLAEAVGFIHGLRHESLPPPHVAVYAITKDGVSVILH